jgi:hypothetical protein
LIRAAIKGNPRQRAFFAADSRGEKKPTEAGFEGMKVS